MQAICTERITRMIKIAVCDDNANFITQTLKYAISIAIKATNINPEVKFFTNGVVLLEKFQNGEYFDIVILDIDMPEINGKELAAKLREIDMSFFLVFITSYAEELVNTIPYRINAFISKGDNIKKCGTELARVFSEYERIMPEREIIEVIDKGETIIMAVPLASIYWFDFSDKTISVRIATNTYILEENVFSKIVDKYSKKGFFETRRNILVNMKKIRSVQETSVVLENGENLPLSRRKRRSLLVAMASSVIVEVS